MTTMTPAPPIEASSMTALSEDVVAFGGVGAIGGAPPPAHVEPEGHASQYVGRCEPARQYVAAEQVQAPLQFEFD